MLKLAWRNIWRNKRRTVLHLSVITFAVVVSSFVRCMQKGIYDNVIYNLAGLHTGYLQVVSPASDSTLSALDQGFSFSPAQLDALRQAGHVQGAAPRLEGPALASSGELSRGAWITGIDQERELQVTNPGARLVQGRMPAGDEMAAVIPLRLSKLLHLGLGDTLLLIGEGYQSQPAYGRYPITGIVNLHSPDLDNRLIYLPMTAAQDFFRTEGRYTSIALSLDQPRFLSRASAQLNEGFRGSAYKVITWEQFMPELRTAIFADEISNRIMVGILYLIITLGISGTLIMMAAERKYEFGVMLAVGMRKRRLAAVLVTEALLLALLGTLAGFSIGGALVLWFHSHPIPLSGSMADGIRTFGVDPIITFSDDPAIFLRQALTVFTITLLLTLFPLRLIRNLKPIEALREK